MRTDRSFGLASPNRPDFIKPNQQEAEEFLGRPLDNDAARWDAVAAFHAAGVRGVFMSLGAEGALFSLDGERLRAVPPRIEEVNPVGSGDALVAGIAMGLIAKRPLEEIARTAIACGTANAMSWDIGHFTRAEVESLAARGAHRARLGLRRLLRFGTHHDCIVRFPRHKSHLQEVRVEARARCRSLRIHRARP